MNKAKKQVNVCDSSSCPFHNIHADTRYVTNPEYLLFKHVSRFEILKYLNVKNYERHLELENLVWPLQ